MDKIVNTFLDSMNYKSCEQALDFFYTSVGGMKVTEEHDCVDCKSQGSTAIVARYYEIAFSMYSVYFNDGKPLSETHARRLLSRLLEFLAATLLKTMLMDRLTHPNEEFSIETSLTNHLIEKVNMHYHIKNHWRTFDLLALRILRKNGRYISLLPMTQIKTEEEFIQFFMNVLRYNRSERNTPLVLHLFYYSSNDEIYIKYGDNRTEIINQIESTLQDCDNCLMELKRLLYNSLIPREKAVVYIERIKALVSELENEN